METHTITEAFAARVRERPGACAVRSGGLRLTYRELDRRANALAHRLIELGVGPETPIAVLMDRSPHLVVALLAAVKAGGCYLPLHAADPFERMQGIIDETTAPVLLTDRARRGKGLPHTGHVVVVDAEPAPSGPSADDPGVHVHPDQLAYVIHTSGSTGRPKGVAVPHRHVTALVADGCWAGGAHERVLMVAPYAFNVSTYETWVPLLRGGTVVTAPEPLEIGALRRLIAEEEITGVHLTAGLFRVLAQEDPAALASVREVLTGGDVIAPAAVRRVLEACPRTVVRAMYGATECTLFSTSSPYSGTFPEQASVPVGRPMDGVRVHVLDDRLAPVAPDEAGDVYISGRLARGYHRRPDLTAERFIADPFGPPGTRMYRTGDRARRTPDGRLEILGRADDQVKIRGFRIELGEVEAALTEHPALAHAAVAVDRDGPGGDRLIAYYVPEHGRETGRVDPADLRAHLTRTLPSYMIPAEFVEMDALPLTPNGKLHRSALRRPGAADDAPAEDASHAGSGRSADPATDLGEHHELLRTAFAEVLGVATVDPQVSFFELGGQSLLAMQLIRRIQERTGVELSMADLFDAPTVAELALKLAARPAAGA